MGLAFPCHHPFRGFPKGTLTPFERSGLAFAVFTDPRGTGPVSALTQVGVANQLSIWRQRLVPHTWRVTGKPEQITGGAGTEMQPSVGADKLALATTTENLGIWVLPVDAATGQAKGEIERVTSSSASNQYPAVSANGNKLVFVSDRRRHFDVYERDLRSGTETALTMNQFDGISPFPSADGARVLFYMWRGDQKPAFTFWEVNSEAGTPRLICGDCDGPLYCWSNDEKRVIYFKSQPGTRGALVVRDLDSGAESVFAMHPRYPVRLPHLSPDERWVAFQTVISQTQRKLFVAPVRDWKAGAEEEWIFIPDARAPTTFSPDGNLLYFLSDRDGFRCIWAQRLDRATRRPVGQSFAVLHLHAARRSLSFSLEIAAIGLSLASNKIYFAMPEHTGNVWIAQLEGRP